MRGLLFACTLASTMAALAQTGWAPLSREVERPYAQALQRFGSNAHTAVRPYATTALREAMPTDSLLPSAAWRKLDTWAGRMNGRRFRWGPLLEADGGYETGTANGARSRGSAGLWTDMEPGTKLVGHRGSDWQTVGRTLTAKLDDTVSVKDFGAVGDGVADVSFFVTVNAQARFQAGRD